MGLTVASMGLFGIGILFYYFGSDIKTIHSIEGLQWELLQLRYSRV